MIEKKNIPFFAEDKLQKVRKYEKENCLSLAERPLFHLTPAVGWMNDPNGFSWFDNQAHLFYQYHPYSMKWGSMHWGHQTSKDLIIWKDLPAALAPDQPYDKDGCFSGTAMEVNGKHLLVYTGVSRDENGTERQQQCAAIGDGINYTKLGNNPIVATEALPQELNRTDFRDPKVIHDKDGWSLLAGCCDEEGNGKIIRFHGDHLESLRFDGYLAESDRSNGKMWECPDYFILDGKPFVIFSPQNMEARALEFHPGHNSVYMCGVMNEDGPKMDGIMHQLDYGFDFYAPQTFLHPDGRRILIAWMSSWHGAMVDEGQKWSSQMSLPRFLEFKENRLYQHPIAELENWRKEGICYKDVLLDDQHAFQAPTSPASDIILNLKSADFRTLEIAIAKTKDHNCLLSFDFKKGILEFDRTHCGMKADIPAIRKGKIPQDGLHQIRLIQDKNSIEIFLNDGEMVLSSALPETKDTESIEIHCEGSGIMDLCIYEIDQEKILAARMENEA